MRNLVFTLKKYIFNFDLTRKEMEQHKNYEATTELIL
jgi:hypothetical protein